MLKNELISLRKYIVFFDIEKWIINIRKSFFNIRNSFLIKKKKIIY